MTKSPPHNMSSIAHACNMDDIKMERILLFLLFSKLMNKTGCQWEGMLAFFHSLPIWFLEGLTKFVFLVLKIISGMNVRF